MSLPPNRSRGSLKARIRAAERLVGCFVFMQAPSIVEILALAGFDFVVIDLEHAPKDWESVENLIRAADVHGLPALVRVPEIAPHWILHALECGAGGIVLPFVQHPEDVQRAARAMFYAPLGERGTCTQTRAAGFGARRGDFMRHAALQNDELVLIGLVESPLGVANAASILTVEPGLDAISVGRSDLASAMGRPGQAGDAHVMAATRTVLQAAQAHPPGYKASAMVIYGASEVSGWAQEGCSIFIAPSESTLLHDAASRWSTDVRVSPSAGSQA